jgi:hypothetical protein
MKEILAHMTAPLVFVPCDPALVPFVILMLRRGNRSLKHIMQIHGQWTLHATGFVLYYVVIYAQIE